MADQSITGVGVGDGVAAGRAGVGVGVGSGVGVGVGSDGEGPALGLAEGATVGSGVASIAITIGTTGEKESSTAPTKITLANAAVARRSIGVRFLVISPGRFLADRSVVAAESRGHH